MRSRLYRLLPRFPFQDIAKHQPRFSALFQGAKHLIDKKAAELEYTISKDSFLQLKATLKDKKGGGDT